MSQGRNRFHPGGLKGRLQAGQDRDHDDDKEMTSRSARIDMGRQKQTGLQAKIKADLPEVEDKNQMAAHQIYRSPFPEFPGRILL